MRYQYKPKNKKSVVIIVVAVLAVLVMNHVFGIGTIRQATRVGFIQKTGWSDWSASYTTVDGYLQRTIRPENDTLLVEVETKSGTIAIEMKDADGNVIFSESDIATTSFEVDVPGKITIRVDADNHKGGFSFE